MNKFKFFDVPLQCDQGTLVVNNNRAPLPGMPVDDNHFGDTFISNNDPEGQGLRQVLEPRKACRGQAADPG